MNYVHKNIIFCLFLITIFKFLIVNSTLPIVIWHGMGDSGYNEGMETIAENIRKEIPSMHTKLVKIGSSRIEDIESGYFVPMMSQIKQVCDELLADPQFANGTHFMGLSQGGLLVRALAQYCPLKGKELGSLISIGGPQQGVYGFPKCPGGVSDIICRMIDKLLSEGAYTSAVQSRLVQAQYWHDPLNPGEYKKYSQFLADINQENHVNTTYRNNMLKLRNLVLVKFADDTIVVPRESEWMGFFDDGNLKHLHDVKQSIQYTEDILGLKTLDKNGRLHLIQIPGDHLHFSLTWFRKEIVRKFLSP